MCCGTLCQINFNRIYPMIKSTVHTNLDSDVIESDIYTLLRIRTGLEEIRDLIQVSIEENTFTHKSAIFSNIAVQNLSKGYLDQPIVIPSLEEYSLEFKLEISSDIANKIKEIWQKIVKRFKEWVIAIITVYYKYFNEVGILERKIQQLLDDAETPEHTKVHINKPKIDLTPGEYKNLLLHKSLDNINDGIQNIGNVISGFGKDSLTVAIAEEMAKHRESIDLSSIEKNALYYKRDYSEAAKLSAIIHKFKNQSIIPYIESNERRFTNTSLYHYLISADRYIGDKIIVVKFVGNEDGLFESIRVFVTDAEPTDNVYDSKYTVKALGIDEIKETTKLLVKMTSIIRTVKTDAHIRNPVVTRLLKATDKIVNQLESIKYDANNKEAYSYAQAFISGTAHVCLSTIQPDLDMINQAMASSMAAYEYCLKSFNNLGE